MPAQQKTVILNGAEYVLQEWSSSQALYWGQTLARIAAGGLDGVHGQSLAANVDIGKLFKGILTALTPAETVTICKGILKDTVIQPEYSDAWFDSHFGPRVDLVIDLCTECVTFNFREAWPSLKKKIQAALSALR